MWQRLGKKLWVRAGFYIGFWTFIGLCFASQLYFFRSQIGDPVSWRFAASRALADWYVFAILALPGLFLAGRFAFEADRWRRSLLLHLIASALFSVAWVVFRSLIALWQDDPGIGPISFYDLVRASLIKTWYFNLLIYWVIISVSHTIGYYRKYQERKVRAAELEKHLIEAKLQALQMQLNPHFLFNTLHAISSLMHQDVEAADRMISRLSELLRRTLENTGTHEVSLEEELAFLRRYLEIEQTRFGPRLTVEMSIAPETLPAQVPNLLLQPVIENAIQHGVEPHARPGRVCLSAKRENGMLRLEVSDNGDGLPQDTTLREGVGLSNTRARLRELYGTRQSFEFLPGKEGGLLVSIAIPFRTEDKSYG